MKHTIALVDDDRNILTSVQMTLEAEGFTVRTYTDGESALQGLIAKMGDSKYKEREAAMQRLMELGPLAFPALKQALANPDAEIAMRAERVLLDQKQSVDIPDAAKAIKQAGGLIQRVLGQ